MQAGFDPKFLFNITSDCSMIIWFPGNWVFSSVQLGLGCEERKKLSIIMNVKELTKIAIITEMVSLVKFLVSFLLTKGIFKLVSTNTYLLCVLNELTLL